MFAALAPLPRTRRLLGALLILALIGLPALAEERTAEAETRVFLTLVGAGVRIDRALMLARAVGIELTAGDDLFAIPAGEVVSAVSDSDEATGVAALGGNDQVTNRGLVQATSDIIADAGDLFLDHGADASTDADALATGISGDSGDDRLVNENLIDATALADALASDIELTLPDGDSANVSINATATATGLDGGEGNDSLTNTAVGVISVTADALARADEMSAYLNGSASADAATIATAFATALDGAAGQDELVNAGSLTVTATSTAEAAGNFQDDIGVIDARIRAESTARGIDGGEDDDRISNDGTVRVESSAWAGTDTYRTEFGGDGTVDSSTTAVALSEGLAGGAGADTVYNTGDLITVATATTETFGLFVGSLDFADGNHADAGVLAAASANGIAGGEGDDRLVNYDLIDSAATATVTVDGVEVSLISAGTTDATAIAEATATGIDGGAGADEISSHGEIVAGATATIDTDDVEVSLIGLGSSGTTAAASADAVGIDGGAGADIIANHDSIVSTADSDAEALSVTVALAQLDLLSNGDGQTTATAHAAGVDAGDGDDTVLNTGSIDVSADAVSSTDMIDVELVGGARSDFSTRAESDAVGIDTGSGDDSVSSTGTLDVESWAEVDSLQVEVRSKGVPPELIDPCQETDQFRRHPLGTDLDLQGVDLGPRFNIERSGAADRVIA